MDYADTGEPEATGGIKLDGVDAANESTFYRTTIHGSG